MEQPFYIKNIFSKFDSESVHRFIIGLLQLIKNIPLTKSLFKKKYFYTSEKIKVKIFDLEFPNPIGLAAGFDKNCIVDSFWEALGFGFYELGTVTLKSQPGFVRPRIFRFPENLALVNQMGFPNEGIESIQARLEGKVHSVPRGLSIGKSLGCPLEQAPLEYAQLVTKSFCFVDYFSINISSPNTPEIGKLQNREYLKILLDHIDQAQASQAKKYNVKLKPVFVKVSPDCSLQVLEDIVGTLKGRSLYGVIATNSTQDKSLYSKKMPQLGGLSGAPLREKSTEVIRKIYKLSAGTIPIIGCGGIFTVRDAIEKIRAGASLLQIYTSFIYYGPELVRELAYGLHSEIESLGFSSLKQLIGLDSK